MIQEGGLVGVAGSGVQGNARDLIAERAGKIGRAGAAQVVAVQYLRLGRDGVAVNAGSDQGETPMTVTGGSCVWAWAGAANRTARMAMLCGTDGLVERQTRGRPDQGRP